MTAVDEVHWQDREAFSDGRAEEWLRYLRNNHPVWRQSDNELGGDVWLVTRHCDVTFVSRNPELFAQDPVNAGVELTPMEAMRREINGEDARPFISMDPPEHGPYRKTIQPGFARRVVDRYTEEILTITHRVLDEALAQGEFDFMADVATEIPLNMVADLIGIPVADRRWLFDLVISTADPEKLMESSMTISAYGKDLILERRKNPKDDLLTALAHREVDGKPVPLEMSAMDFFVMWGAGHDTTRNSLGWGMYAFCQYPDQYQKVREDPSLLDGPAVAEILRWASPVHQFRRHVTQDVELSGVKLTRGQDVIIWYSSGNRDEEVFDDPYTFDVTRAANPHMAFGGGGPHMCIGQYLAKLELKLVFNELIKRLPQPKLAGEPVRFKDNFLRGLTTLPINVT